MRLLLPFLLVGVCLAKVKEDVTKCQTEVLPKADLRTSPDQAGFHEGVRQFKAKDFAGAFPIFSSCGQCRELARTATGGIAV